MKLADIIPHIISKTMIFKGLRAGKAMLEETRERLTPVYFSKDMLEMERKTGWWEMNETVGFSLDVPNDASGISCSVLAESSGNPVAQIRFNLYGTNYTYRAVAALLFSGTEISSFSADWEETDTVYIQYRKACFRRSESVSVITWHDAASGISYSLSAEGHVKKADIVYAARAAFASESVPFQGAVMLG